MQSWLQDSVPGFGVESVGADGRAEASPSTSPLHLYRSSGRIYTFVGPIFTIIRPSSTSDPDIEKLFDAVLSMRGEIGWWSIFEVIPRCSIAVDRV
jgi:hypothetical protein